MSDEEPVDAGELPPWGTQDMPEPPPFKLRNIIAVVGPGAIALSLCLGGGEWLLGPSVTLKYGVGLLWITLVAVVLQAILNMEFARYTLYTGEPILTGFMRTKPGSKVWGPFYTILGIFNVGWPGWAALSAIALFAALWGRVPTGADATIISGLGMATFLCTILIVTFGGRIERTLEILSTVTVLFIICYLTIICLWLAPANLWGKAFAGFFRFGYLPKPETGVIDWVTLGAFAAFSGGGGLGNLWITNWIRDKGFGMAKTVGFIPTVVSGKQLSLSHVGNVFPNTPENRSRWKVWWKYLNIDQGLIFIIGCLAGMFLCVLAANAIIQPGTDLTARFSVGIEQARHLAQLGGNALWFLTLFVGFWILFGTQITIIDGFTRTVTDMLWSGSSRVRKWRGGNVKFVYFAILIVFAAWGCIAIWLARPAFLIVVGANIGALIFAISGVHVVITNYRFLPREIRPAIWRVVAVFACVVFYSFFLVMTLIHWKW
jgi:hypothetical protein